MTTDDDAVQKRRMGVAQLVRAERERSGLTVVEAAELADIGRSTWTEIEAGAPPMKKAATLAKVAKVLKVDPDRVLTVAGYRDAEVTPPSGDNWAAVWRALDRIEERLDAVETQLELTAPARLAPSDRAAP